MMVVQVMKGIRNFLNVDRIKVIVLSYETFRRYVELFLTKAETCCDLLILDEAHRLKNNATGTSVALSSLPCRRRVLLSGTPLQNDLVEFFAIVNFTNPGVLGTPNHFRRHYQSPILTGREPDSTEEEDAKGKQRSQDLSNIVNDFILRRSNELNRKHLPEKVVNVVCIKLTPLQRKIYQHMLMAKEISLQQEGAHTRTLPTINALKKLCNHPKLIFDDIRAAQVAGTLAQAAHGFQDARSLFPADFEGRQRGKQNQAQIELAGKMNVLAQVRCQCVQVSVLFYSVRCLGHPSAGWCSPSGTQVEFPVACMHACMHVGRYYGMPTALTLFVRVFCNAVLCACVRLRCNADAVEAAPREARTHRDCVQLHAGAGCCARALRCTSRVGVFTTTTTTTVSFPRRCCPLSQIGGRLLLVGWSVGACCSVRRLRPCAVVLNSVSIFHKQTLDIVSTMCRESRYPFVRLDGSTTVKKRQQLVNRFNSKEDVFVFLLSSKAGGCGLNLIGGSRLILFDPDWNPATDKQVSAKLFLSLLLTCWGGVGWGRLRVVTASGRCVRAWEVGLAWLGVSL